MGIKFRPKALMVRYFLNLFNFELSFQDSSWHIVYLQRQQLYSSFSESSIFMLFKNLSMIYLLETGIPYSVQNGMVFAVSEGPLCLCTLPLFLSCLLWVQCLYIYLYLNNDISRQHHKDAFLSLPF